MLDNPQARRFAARAIEPPARALLRLNLTPDHVTWLGTFGVIVSSYIAAMGRPFLGGLVYTVVACADLLDGTMARLSGRTSTWGAFLDSSLDRVADGAMLLGYSWYLAHTGASGFYVLAAQVALIGALVTSYLRARAEAVGARCTVGIAERSERNILIGAGLVLSPWWTQSVAICSVALAILAWITVAQRMVHVRAQLKS